MSHIEVIAEAGICHNGQVHNALMLTSMAKWAGADAVKFQLYDPETMVKTEMREMLKRYQLSDTSHHVVADHCKAIGIEYMASCFSEERVDFALSLGVKRIKIGSGEIQNHALIERVASVGLPIIISTGMAVMDDIYRAQGAYADAGGKHCTLLHCVSNYPTDPEHCNLKGISTLLYNFGKRQVAHGKWRECAIGFSDHCLYDAPAFMAVALGATVIEKHFTLDRSMEGPDHHMALSPDSLKRYIRGIRVAQVCMGDGDRNTLQPGEAEMQKIARGRW